MYLVACGYLQGMDSLLENDQAGQGMVYVPGWKIICYSIWGNLEVSPAP